MKREYKSLNVYVADDGKEFLSEDECSIYENTVLVDKRHIKYFRVDFCPDLTETGLMTKCMFVAVYAMHSHQEILTNWLVVDKEIPIIGEGVQGYGYQPHFTIFPSSEEEYFKSKADQVIDIGRFSCIDKGKFFLSPKKVEGYPGNFDYIKIWDLK